MADAVPALPPLPEEVKKVPIVHIALLWTLLIVVVAVGGLWVKSLYGIIEAKDETIRTKEDRITGLKDDLTNRKDFYQNELDAEERENKRVTKQKDELLTNLEHASGWPRWFVDECEKRVKTLEQTAPELRDEQIRLLMTWIQGRRIEAQTLVFGAFIEKRHIPPATGPAPLVCSPKTDPPDMRVSAALVGQEILDEEEATQPGADHSEAPGSRRAAVGG